MATICFVTWDGGGNLPPTLGVAAELAARGHSVTVMGHPAQSRAITDAGVEFAGYPTADTDLRELALFADRGHGRDVLRRLEEHPADLVVVDTFLFGVMDRLRRADRDYVAFVHLFEGRLRTALRGPAGLLLRAKGVRALPLLDAAEARVVTAMASLDAKHGDGATHVGPVADGTPAQPDAPMVLLSLSTYPYRSLTGTWQRLLDAVDGLPARVVATLGPHVDPGDLAVPDGVEVHRWLPHSEVLPHASIVVTHGGHGTAMAALAHDLPLLVLPLDRRVDQPAVGRAVVRSGAGRMLSRGSTGRRIRRAIDDLLADDGYRAAAARLGSEIRRTDARRAGADALEAQVGKRSPAAQADPEGSVG